MPPERPGRSLTRLSKYLARFLLGFRSIYSAHGAFTAAVTPPLVVALLCSVFWRRFTRPAALCTLIGGMAAIVFSFFVPQVIAPFAHGVPMGERGAGMWGGLQQYKFMRALYGVAVSGGIAVVVTLLTRPEPFPRCRGLVWGTVADALKRYKGSAGLERPVTRALAVVRVVGAELLDAPSGLPTVRISQQLAETLDADTGDLLYITDTRRWLGGLHSTHAIAAEVIDADDTSLVELGPKACAAVVTPSRRASPVEVQRLY